LKPNRTLRSRGEANNARLARFLRSRVPKPKIFPYNSFFGGGCGGSRQKMERKIFGFGSAASGLQKERHLNYIILVALFSVPCGGEARPRHRV